MWKIGVTGGIGSGKSTVCQLFRNLGVPIFIADEEGRRLLNNNSEVIQSVKDTFGEDMYTSSGEIDRQRMSQLVFSDPRELEKVSQIIHPRVKENFAKWCLLQEGKPYVIKEAAILFESGSYHDLDKVINIFAPKEQRIARVLKRDGSSQSEVEKRMRFQYSDQERNELADLIIMNEDGKEKELLPQVMEMHELFINETKKW